MVERLTQLIRSKFDIILTTLYFMPLILSTVATLRASYCWTSNSAPCSLF